ncbi:MAG: hypothetical protein VSS75_005335 [Candidatus Parabeggiatoa sp.]|nr:hypothetical protein [Candidatus Parabeggiatoa sp.]
MIDYSEGVYGLGNHKYLSIACLSKGQPQGLAPTQDVFHALGKRYTSKEYSMTTWTPEIEQRFTELRLRKLTRGSLNEAEQKELASITTMVDIVESDTAAGALKRLETEQKALQSVLEKSQIENQELVQLFNQQALLIADSKHWLAEFEQRYAVIQNAFRRLTPHSLVTS